MADVKPLKLVDQGGGAGRLEEFGAGDRVPAENLPATEWAAETVPQVEAEAGTETTRRAWTAQRVRQAIVAWWNGISSAWGRGFVASANDSAGRTALGLGSAATRTALGTTGSLYSRDSILGTVSQSGGIPTGAIIERGSNANGEYVKYADGTLECTIAAPSMSVGASSKGVYVWNFPSSFSSVPVVLCGAHLSTEVNQRPVFGLSRGPFTVTQVRLCIVNQHNSAIDVVAMGYAIGRWY